jgi:hypothetical protein
MIRNEYHVSFILTDTLKPHPEISFDFLSNHVKIVASTNQKALVFLTYNRP